MGILDLKKRRNKMNHTNAIGSNWKDVRKELFTQDKICKSDEKELQRLVKQLKNKRKNSKRKKIRNFCKD